jgi:hypothetical protein
VLTKEAATEEVVRALKEITVVYQHAADGPPRVAERSVRDQAGGTDATIRGAHRAY